MHHLLLPELFPPHMNLWADLNALLRKLTLLTQTPTWIYRGTTFTPEKCEEREQKRMNGKWSERRTGRARGRDISYLQNRWPNLFPQKPKRQVLSVNTDYFINPVWCITTTLSSNHLYEKLYPCAKSLNLTRHSGRRNCQTIKFTNI